MKQIGLGIAQYTQDYDEKFPLTRTNNININGTNVNGAPWHVVVQPYVKSAQLFTCPSNTSTNSMNNSQGTIPVSYVASHGADDDLDNNNSGSLYGGRGPMGPNNFGSAPSASLSSIQSSALVILVGEHQNRQDPEYWDNNGDMLMQGHLGTTNFLFCDGHVKALKPTATGTPINMWNINNVSNWGDVNTGPANSGLLAILQNSQQVIQ